jgi:ketosteroid isomerase-like protein
LVSNSDVEALRAVYTEIARGNFAAMLPLLDPDVEWRWTSDQMGLTGDERYRGVEEVSRAMVGWLRTWQSFAVEAEEFIESDDRIIVLTRLRARARGSSADIESRQADIYTFRDGRIIRIENTPREEIRAAADS